ncbi:hypothetical protein VTO73DRAFT_4351 [Trametes versicolor]
MYDRQCPPEFHTDHYAVDVSEPRRGRVWLAVYETRTARSGSWPMSLCSYTLALRKGLAREEHTLNLEYALYVVASMLSLSYKLPSSTQLEAIPGLEGQTLLLQLALNSPAKGLHPGGGHHSPSEFAIVGVPRTLIVCGGVPSGEAQPEAL